MQIVFNNERNREKDMQDQIDTLIGEGTTINGDLHFKGGLHIDGKIEGSVTCDAADGGLLIISDLARVKGEVKVPRIVINGLLEGDLTATEKLELQEKARVNGNIFYRNIEMTMGAQVNGQLNYQAEPSVTSPKPVADIALASAPAKK
jgi:cytoskeletal protein CcmA (bactofilin family)